MVNAPGQPANIEWVGDEPHMQAAEPRPFESTAAVADTAADRESSSVRDPGQPRSSAEPAVEPDSPRSSTHAPAPKQDFVAAPPPSDSVVVVDDPAAELKNGVASHGPATMRRGRFKSTTSRVKDLMEKHLPEVETCYRSVLVAAPTLAGEVVVRITVAAMGQVADAKVTKTSLDHEYLHKCILSAAQNWSFGRPTGKTVVFDYPFRLAQGLAGSLLKSSIATIIKRHIKQVRSCRLAGLARDPFLAGRLVVRFTIAPSGRVAAADVQDDGLNSPTVAPCVLRALRTWTFPKPKGRGPVVVTYPFVFGPRAKARPARAYSEAMRCIKTIVRVIRSRDDQTRTCFIAGLSRDLALEGQVIIRFVVGPSGEVLSAEPRDSTFGKSGVDTCIKRVVRGWTFPPCKTRRPAVVSHPFVLRNEANKPKPYHPVYLR